MAQIKFVPIFPKKPLKILITSREMKKSMRDETFEMEKLFKQVSDGFQSTNVQYNKVVDTVSGDLVGITHTTNEVMSYLNFGTKIRWALMSNPYIAQTRPRSLARAAGVGHPILRGRRAMQARGIPPRPGIRARHFDKEVAKQRRKPFRKAMQDAIRKGLV